jgi:orotidine-5'-phosphate decarboxylase
VPEPFVARLAWTTAQIGGLCVGIDPSAELLARWGLGDDAQGVELLSRATIDAIEGIAGVVKPQVAHFERHGAAGYAALERVIAHAGAAGLLVIADAKRGDFDVTNDAYAAAWLGDSSPLAADAVTVTCYLGTAALRGFFSLASETGRAVFCVASSSNPEGRPLQTARMDGGRTVEAAVLAELEAVNVALATGSHPAPVAGAVVGAQREPDGLAELTGPVLVPGVGAQGGGADEVRRLRASMSHGAVTVSVSRGILAAGPDGAAIRGAAERYRDQIG